MKKCNSCEKGYNGRNGNGYQPCGCRPPEPPPCREVPDSGGPALWLLAAVAWVLLALIY